MNDGAWRERKCAIREFMNIKLLYMLDACDREPSVEL